MNHVELTLRAFVLTDMVKSASAYPGYNGLAMQGFLPVNKRRELSPEEQSQVTSAQGNIMPRIFTSEADPLTADMASPAISGAAGGAMGAGLGGLVGAGISRGDPRIAAIAALLGGGLGGVTGYLGRNAKNKTLVNRMQNLPPGATRRDMEADPVYQREEDRNSSRSNAVMQASMLGSLLNR